MIKRSFGFTFLVLAVLGLLLVGCPKEEKVDGTGGGGAGVTGTDLPIHCAGKNDTIGLTVDAMGDVGSKNEIVCGTKGTLIEWTAANGAMPNGFDLEFPNEDTGAFQHSHDADKRRHRVKIDTKHRATHKYQTSWNGGTNHGPDPIIIIYP